MATEAELTTGSASAATEHTEGPLHGPVRGGCGDMVSGADAASDEAEKRSPLHDLQDQALRADVRHISGSLVLPSVWQNERAAAR